MPYTTQHDIKLVKWEAGYQWAQIAVAIKMKKVGDYNASSYRHSTQPQQSALTKKGKMTATI